MDELLTMSKKELTRVEIMKRLDEKRMRQKEGAEMLGVSARHVRRLLKAYRQAGEKGLVSRRRGRSSNHQISPEILTRARDLLFERYADFGPTLAHEKLTEEHDLHISRERVRQLMIAEGLWKVKKLKRSNIFK